MSYLKFLTVVLTTIFAINANARGRETGNGGDPLALEFIDKALEAIALTEREPEKYSEVGEVNLRKILDGTKVLVVDEPLKVEVDGVTTSPPAANFENPKRILIYRKGWEDLKENKYRLKWALHEVLCLAKLEQSGVYKISRRAEETRPVVESNPKVDFSPGPRQMWPFHKPTPDEVKAFSGVIPKIAGQRFQPTKIGGVSAPRYLPMRDSSDWVVKVMIVQVLKYSFRDNIDDGFEDRYQLVVRDFTGKIHSSNIIYETRAIQVWTTIDPGGGQQIGVYALVEEPNSCYAAIHGRQKLSDEGSYKRLDFWYSRIKDYALPKTGGVLLLGSPYEDAAYGLYRTGPDNELVRLKKLESKIPNSLALVATRIFGVYSHEKDTYALVGDLGGLMSINTKGGDSRMIYELPEVDQATRFAWVSSVKAQSNCVALELAIYRNSQGSVFNSRNGHGNFPGNPGKDDPDYLLHLGVMAHPDYFFYLTKNGCPQPKTVERN